MLALTSTAKQDFLVTFHFYLNDGERRPTLNLSVFPESNANSSKENENDPGVAIRCKSRSRFCPSRGSSSALKLFIQTQYIE